MSRSLSMDQRKVLHDWMLENREEVVDTCVECTELAGAFLTEEDWNDWVSDFIKGLLVEDGWPTIVNPQDRLYSYWQMPKKYLELHGHCYVFVRQEGTPV